MQNFPFKTISKQLWLYYYNADKTFLSFEYISPAPEVKTLIPPNEARYLKFMLYSSDNQMSTRDADKEIIIVQSTLENYYIKRIVVTSNTAESVYSSLASNFPINTEIACSKTWFADLASFQDGWYYIKTIATSQNTGTASQRLQIAFTGIAPNGISIPDDFVIAYRYLITNSEYSDWIMIYSHKTRSPLYIAFGDSVCRGNYPDGSKSKYAWPEAFAAFQKMTCLNKAIGGQGYLTTQYAVKAIDTIKGTDITKANLITLAFGINDAADQDVAIGTANDTTENTVFGEVYRCVNYIYEQNKKVQLILCGSTKQNGEWSQRLALINTIMKEFAQKYNIPFVDMAYSPINQFNGQTDGVLTSDGTHFNDDGYILLSQYMLGKIGAFFMN